MCKNGQHIFLELYKYNNDYKFQMMAAKIFRSNLSVVQQLPYLSRSASSIQFRSLPSIPLPPCNVEPKPYNGPTYDEIMSTRKSKLNPGLVTFYKKPLFVTQVIISYTGKT